MKLNVYMGSISSCLELPARDFQLNQLLERFKRNHTVFDFMNRKKIVDQYGNVRMGPPPVKAVYYIEYDNRVYLPVITMKRLLATLHGSGYEIVVFDVSDDLPDKVNITYKNEITLYPIQKVAAKKLPLYPHAAKLLSLQPGGGKSLSDTTPVPTPNGFTLHGNLKVGDEVIGSDGYPTKVTGFYPQPLQKLYRVWFVDDTYLDANGEHLWDVIDTRSQLCINGKREMNYKRKVMTTLDIINGGYKIREYDKRYDTTRIRSRYAVPKHNGWFGGSDDELPIDPYLLGCLLGDGCLVSTPVSMTNGSPDLLETLRDKCPLGTDMSDVRKIGVNTWLVSFRIDKENAQYDNLTKRLKDLGLYGHKAFTKFIPEMYLKSTFENRKALYQGLVDTDGHVNSKDVMREYSTSSERLKDDFLQLGRPLGVILTAKSRIPKYTYKGEVLNGSKNWRISEKTYGCGKPIVNIEEHSYESASSCISVAADDNLYMAGDHYTLTHNTFTSMVVAVSRGYRFMVFAKSGDVNQFKEEIEEELNADFVSINGTDKLIKLLEKAKEDNEYHDIVLISLQTYRSYVKRWLQGDERITVKPYELAQVLKLGTIIADECHKEMNALWMLMSLTNVDMLIGLSGTMSTDDARDRLAQNDMFPYDSRFVERDIKPYIRLITYVYGVNNPSMMVYHPRGRSSYSHMALEKWILQSPGRTSTYVRMIGTMVEDYYLKRRKLGDRCMVFVTLVKMAEALLKHLHIRFKDDYDVTYINYTGVLKKDKLVGKELIISTIGKAGTSLDIKGLITLVNTVAISKVETGKQNIQRLRRPKGVILHKYMEDYMDDVERIAVQLQCADINTHAVYARNRARLISTLITEQDTVISNFRL